MNHYKYGTQICFDGFFYISRFCCCRIVFHLSQKFRFCGSPNATTMNLFKLDFPGLVALQNISGCKKMNKSNIPREASVEICRKAKAY